MPYRTPSPPPCPPHPAELDPCPGIWLEHVVGFGLFALVMSWVWEIGWLGLAKALAP